MSAEIYLECVISNDNTISNNNTNFFGTFNSNPQSLQADNDDWTNDVFLINNVPQNGDPTVNPPPDNARNYYPSDFSTNEPPLDDLNAHLHFHAHDLDFRAHDAADAPCDVEVSSIISDYRYDSTSILVDLGVFESGHDPRLTEPTDVWTASSLDTMHKYKYVGHHVDDLPNNAAECPTNDQHNAPHYLRNSIELHNAYQQTDPSNFSNDRHEPAHLDPSNNNYNAPHQRPLPHQHSTPSKLSMHDPHDVCSKKAKHGPDHVHLFEIPSTAPIFSAATARNGNLKGGPSSRFAGYCLDSGTARSVTGRRQYHALCESIHRKLKVKPSSTRFKFGDTNFTSEGRFRTRLRVTKIGSWSSKLKS